MVLDFGLMQNPVGVQSSDYRSAGSHQIENLKFASTGTAATWVVIHTVTTGKTFYVSGIIFCTDKPIVSMMFLGTGAAGSETVVLSVYAGVATGTNASQVITMPTPIKFVSGTRISVQSSTDGSSRYTLVGWEE